MEKTNWFNYKGEVFRIKIDDYKKIEELGEAAGKYLTFNGEINAWELTNERNAFNADRTHKYTCYHMNEKTKEVYPTYDVIAWSLGYIYTSGKHDEFLDKTE